ncbi:hypothetical protein ACXX9E_29460 [Pseudomonas sp. GNP014]
MTSSDKPLSHWQPARGAQRRYKDGSSDELRTVELGKNLVEIVVAQHDSAQRHHRASPRGEIIVNNRGETSISGHLLRCCDATAPYKQSVIAVGEGARLR